MSPLLRIITRSIIRNYGFIITYYRPGQLGDESLGAGRVLLHVGAAATVAPVPLATGRGDTLMVWHLGWCNKLAGESPPILLAVWETGARPAWVWESGLGVNSKVRLCSLRRLLQQGLVRAFAEMKRVASEKKSGSSSLNAQTGWSAQISLLHLINKSACCRWTNQRKTIVHMACCSLQRSSKRKQAQDNISLFSNASVKTEKLGTIV